MKEIILKPILLLAVVTVFLTYSSAQVAIGTSGTATPNPKAVLLLTGANQGLIIPIVNSKGSVNATITEKGMVVFDDSDKKVYFFDGIAWNQLGGGSGGSQSISINQNLIQLSGSPASSFPLASAAGPAANQNGQLLMWNQTSSRWEATANTPTATNGMVLTWNGTTNTWEPKLASAAGTVADGSITGGTAGVGVKIAANTITDANISSTAAIAGSKVTPIFGTQNISTTGTLNAGATTVSGLIVSGSTTINTKSYTWPSTTALAGTFLQNDGLGNLTWAPAVGAGTVTSVGLAMPSIFTVSNSPVITSGTLTAALNSQSANTVFAAPNGSAGAPIFRTLTALDIPSLSAAQITSGTLSVGVGGTGATSLTGLLVGNGAGPFTAITTGTNGQVLTVNLGAPSWQPAPPPTGAAGGDLTGTYPTPTISTAALTGSTIITAINNSINIINGARVNPAFAQPISTLSTLTTGLTGQFVVDATGNITKINNITTSFPAAQGGAGTVLTNNGAGILTWSTSSGGWNLIGNAATNPATDFVGTTDLQPLRLATNGTERMIIDAAGNIGIGTSSPTTKLDVAGTANTTGLNVTNSNSDIATFKSTSVSDSRILFANSGGIFGTLGYTPFNNTFALTTYTNLDLSIGSNNLATEIMRLKAGGNVGIGTTAPVSKLDVAGGITVGASYAGVTAAPVNGMVVEGNVGIGNITPIYPLDIKTGTSTYGLNHSDGTIIMSTYVGNGGGPIGGSIGTQSNHPFFIYTANGGAKLTALPNGNIGIGENLPVNKLDIKGGVAIGATYSGTNIAPISGLLVEGNVGIGLTSPTYKLDVAGTIRTSGQYYFTGTSASNVSYQQYIGSVSGSYIYITDHFIPNLGNQQDLGTASFRWRTLYTNNTVNVSDFRLKKDITPLNYGLKEVLSLRPVSYIMKDDNEGEIKLGLIAQEVQKLVPEVVSQDNSSQEKYLGMNYTELVPVLIKAAQELNVKIEALEKENSELKGTNTILQTEVASLKDKQVSEMDAMKKQLEQIKKALGLDVSSKRK